MLNTLKFIALVTVGLVSGFGMGLGVVYSVNQSHQAPSLEEGGNWEVSGISSALPVADRKAIKKSRLSSVRVMSLSEDQETFSAASGTYFTADGKYYVLTVNHGIVGPCPLTKIKFEDGYVPCLRYVELNPQIDYAIIEVAELKGRVPLKIPQDLPRSFRPYHIMTATYYTGFPNSGGPFTLAGNIIGYLGSDFVYLQSYGWAGSSGAGVFAANGDLIGYVLAVDVGYTAYGVDVLENIMFVVPVMNINWDAIAR